MDISISFSLLALHIRISAEFQAPAIGFPQRVAQYPPTLASPTEGASGNWGRAGLLRFPGRVPPQDARPAFPSRTVGKKGNQSDVSRQSKLWQQPTNSEGPCGIVASIMALAFAGTAAAQQQADRSEGTVT